MKNLSRKIRRRKPQHITISSFAVAKNITPISGVPMKLYLHSPMQYIRSHYDEYDKKLTGLKRNLFHLIVPRLRRRDKKFTKFDVIYANSQYTANLAKELYDMKATVLYPKLDELYYTTPVSEKYLPYYVYVGRLVAFVKECDLMIKLFNKLQKPLIMIGSGPDEHYLKSIAGDTITFLGRKESAEIAPIIQKSKGLINLTKESFGMITAEALLLGVPVFGYNDGATPELVDKDTGILVENKDNFHEVLEQFRCFDEKKVWNRKQIALHIRRKLAVKAP